MSIRIGDLSFRGTSVLDELIDLDNNSGSNNLNGEIEGDEDEINDETFGGDDSDTFGDLAPDALPAFFGSSGGGDLTSFSILGQAPSSSSSTSSNSMANANATSKLEFGGLGNFGESDSGDNVGGIRALSLRDVEKLLAGRV